MMSIEPFPDRSGSMSCKLAQIGYCQSPSCDCGQQQTMNCIVDTCPLTKIAGGLNLLYEADDDEVIWLESIATAALKIFDSQFISFRINFYLLPHCW